MKLGEGAGRQSGTGGVKDVKVCCTVGCFLKGSKQG